MTESELELVIARTGHARFRELTGDANSNAWDREQWRRKVSQMAAGEAPCPKPAPEPPRPTIPLADSIRAVKLGLHRCPYASKADCGCSAPHCHHLGRMVGVADCAACLGPAKTTNTETDAHVDPL